MKKGIGLVIILFVLVFVPLVCSLTATISNPRMVLYKNITSGETLEFQNSVIVINDNDFDVKIVLSLSESFEDLIEIAEPESILKKGETKEFFYNIEINKQGHYQGDILVTFLEEDSNKELSLVQELEIFVNEQEKANKLYLVLGLVLLIILLIVLIIIKSKRNKK